MSSNGEPVDDARSQWAGRLNEWLDEVVRPSQQFPADLIHWEFPTDELKNEYLAQIYTRPDDEVRTLIRRFSIESGRLGADDWTIRSLSWALKNDHAQARRMLLFESTRRLLLSARDGAPPPWEGTTWILDLLPHWPREALNALSAYLLAHAQQLPDGRRGGLYDIQSIIRARWIEVPRGSSAGTRKHASLAALTPREFEHVVEALMNGMGYATRLTPASADGGRDIEARLERPSARALVYVECKLHARPIGVHFVRALLGAVATGRANKGLLVTNSSFTRGSLALEAIDTHVELVSGTQLIELLNEYVSPAWENRLDKILEASKLRQMSADAP